MAQHPHNHDIHLKNKIHFVIYILWFCYIFYRLLHIEFKEGTAKVSCGYGLKSGWFDCLKQCVSLLNFLSLYNNVVCCC